MTGISARHRQTLGVLWCVAGGLHVLASVVAVALLHGMAMHGAPGWASGSADWVNWLIPIAIVVPGLMAAFSIAAGYGLLAGRGWARQLAIVAGVLTILHPPLGTGLGAYTLWVLLRRH